MSDRIARIVDEVLEKRPELASDRGRIEEEVESLDDFAEQLLGTLEMAKTQLPEVLPKIALDSSLVPKVKAEFAHWGIDIMKFGALVGLETEDDVVKLMQMSLAQNPATELWKEAMKTLLLARLRPDEIDILVG